MERLTKRCDRGDGVIEVIHYGHRYGRAFFPVKHEYDEYVTIIDRLAAYEDSGLEPEEVKRVQETLVTAQRLKKEQYDVLEKYLKAEAEDRLVILPCKVGTEVFALWYGANVIPGTVIGYSLHEWTEAASVRVLFDTKKVNGTRDYSIGAFGKTLFFSREEAESALKGAANGNM